MKKEFLKNLAKPIIYPLAIGIVLWEKLAYKPIKAITNYLEKNKVLHKISDKIRHSNPYIAMAILACAGLPLVPFKIAGLYLVGHGYTALGIGTFGLAKVIGGAVSLHLFNLTEPAIRKLPWANTALDWTFDKKNKIKKVLVESSAYIATKEVIHNIKQKLKESLNNNTYYQKLKEKFKKKDNTEDKFIVNESFPIKITEEMTITQKITAKVDMMNNTVAALVEQVTIQETIKLEPIKKENNQEEVKKNKM